MCYNVLMTRIKGVYYNGNTETHKRCPICGVRKERSEFYKWKARRDGLTAYCKVCFLEKNEKWHGNNPEESLKSRRATKRKREFGITHDDMQKMLDDQENKCKICETGVDFGSAVDHCHKTGKIRGILCRKCNLGLGAFKDNIDFIEKAIKYLEKYENL